MTSQFSSSQSHVFTVLGAASRLGLISNKSGRLVIHVLGADEVEVPSLIVDDLKLKWLPLLEAVESNSIQTLEIILIGPNMPLTHYNKATMEPAVVEFDYKDLKTKFECWGCTYDAYYVLDQEQQMPACVIALNAGIWGYESWNASIELFFSYWQKSIYNQALVKCHFVITSYTLEESEDDYDRVAELYSLSKVSGVVRSKSKTKTHDMRLEWVWDCEANPSACTDVVDRLGRGDGVVKGREYRENKYWQCITGSQTKESSLTLSAEYNRTCRRCHEKFNLATNAAKSKECIFHPESFSGETAQRWLAPGDQSGGATIHDMWTCCGKTENEAPGCCGTFHESYDGDVGLGLDADALHQNQNRAGDAGTSEASYGRRPGMGI